MDEIREEELRQIRLFKSVDLESIKGLIDACTVRFLEKDEVLINRGELNRTVYFLLEGHVRIHLESLQGRPAVILGPGESVAEMSVIDRQPTSAFVVADEPTRLLAMDEDILWSLIQSSHAAACNLIGSLTARLRHADQVISEMVDTGDSRGQGTIDGLTGLHNRYWLEQTIERQVQRCVTDGRPICVIMINIDYFKTFNERYGHAHGDRVLYSVAHAIGDHLRPAEIIARYGGDEFVVLLPRVEPEMARRIAERLQKGVMGSVPVMPDGTTIPHPTISIGLAALQPGQTGKMLLAEARKAISRAKNSGGNCISE
jgi:diguanylate cyclase (GGDEF)-like protein